MTRNLAEKYQLTLIFYLMPSVGMNERKDVILFSPTQNEKMVSFLDKIVRQDSMNVI